MIRIFAISDLHVDYQQNFRWVENLSKFEYKKDILLIAGDISDDHNLLERIFILLKKKFATVAFVPGNHDLWVRKKEASNSYEKFNLLKKISKSNGIETEPFFIVNGSRTYTRIVPVYGWYQKPEEGKESLYLEKKGEDTSLSMWVDNYAISWPEKVKKSGAAYYFNSLNTLQNVSEPIITFSHFLPLSALIFPKNFKYDPNFVYDKDPAPKFNFSRVAGTTLIEKYIRSIGSQAHIYGHQHRNRFRIIDGIRYISHGLGYPKERSRAGVSDAQLQPKCIWSTQEGFLNYPEN